MLLVSYKLSLHLMTLQEFMSKTKRLEDRLMVVNRQKELLNGELARMPGNGRTLAERHRKAAAEDELASLTRESGTIKLNLKQLGALAR